MPELSAAASYVVTTVNGKKKRFPRAWFMHLEGPLPDLDWPNDGCTFSPDRWTKASVWPACWIHDWHYSGQVDGLKREEADARFFGNVVMCLSLAGWPSLATMAVASVYWIGVRLFGRKHWGCGSIGKATRLQRV